MNELFLDLETFSSVDLGKCGAYKYAASPDFEILLFAYSVDGGEVQVVDIASGEDVPDEILAALEDDKITKWSYNVNFERVCLSSFLNYPTGEFLSPSAWRCSMIWAAYLGLPQSLAGAGAVLQVDKKKLEEGKDLIRYFCVPCKVTKANGGRERNLPEDAPEKWELFKKYNKRDVETEMEIQQKLSRFPVPDSVWEEFIIDQEINDRGILVDMEMVENAIRIDEKVHEELTDKMKELTELDNPQSVQQLKGWLADNGLEMDSLGKDVVKEAVKTAPEPLREVLTLRQQISKSSVKKYVTMENATCEDNRLRGMFRFIGANRTGRWCLSADHEVLTKRGWRKISTPFNCRPEIAIYDAGNGTIRFEKSKIVSFDYDGDMYLWDSKRVSQLSTPEHRNLVTDEHGARKVRYVANLSGSEKLPVGGLLSNGESVKFSDDELRLLVAYQADGIAAGGRRNGLAFRFTKPRKIQRMRDILERLNYPFEECKHGDGATCIRVKADCYNPDIKTKQLTWALLNENAEVFFDEVGYWDGHIETNNSVQYVTTNKRNAEIVATFAHLSGRAAVINSREASGNWSAAYYVEIWNNVLPEGVSIPCAPQRIDGVPQKVYCAETSTGFFLVRRNNKIWVTGNSSKTLNLQNLPQNHLPDLEEARALVKTGDYEALLLLYDDIPDTLSQLIRTAFIPSPGRRYFVADFSSIEARVLSWIAGEQWRIDSFREGKDIYCMSASSMFGVPVEKHGVNGHLRAKGKIAELACGFGGSVGAMKAMGAGKMGLSDDEIQEIVTAWRNASPSIVKFWWDIDRAVMKCMKEGGVAHVKCVKIRKESGMLIITLPSGRELFYVKPRIGENKFGGECVTYEGREGAGKWGRVESYGPKFVENIIQGIARDILCYAMRNLREYDVVAHIHDELVIEAPPETSLEKICELMGRTPPWAEGLLLRADGFISDFYKKDD